MRRLFLDANIFFSAVWSKGGGSFSLLELAKRGMVDLVTVAHALSEAERNIGAKIGARALLAHYENLLAIDLEVQSLLLVPLSFELQLKHCLPEKDIPILLGAYLSQSDGLVTLDRKHLLENAGLKALNFPFWIMTPGDVLQRLVRV
jgi:predicted nucleic acid-binding protein